MIYSAPINSQYNSTKFFNFHENVWKKIIFFYQTGTYNIGCCYSRMKNKFFLFFLLITLYIVMMIWVFNEFFYYHYFYYYVFWRIPFRWLIYEVYLQHLIYFISKKTDGRYLWEIYARIKNEKYWTTIKCLFLLFERDFFVLSLIRKASISCGCVVRNFIHVPILSMICHKNLYCIHSWWCVLSKHPTDFWASKVRFLKF